MFPVQRLGDPNGAGGIVTSGDPTVLVNGRPIAYPGIRVSPHPPCGPRAPQHCAATTTMGSASVRVNGKPVLYTGCVDTCAHVRAGGSPDVRVG